MPTTDRPNFLFIITDQQRADHLGCAGNPLLRTPHIDSLAARGTRFSNFHASSPICMPARASLMTGRMTSAHGLRGNGMPLRLDQTTFTDLLLAAGYRTSLIGKIHLQNMMSEGAIEKKQPQDPALTPPPGHLSEATKTWPGEGPYDQEMEQLWINDPDHGLTLPYYGFEEADLCINHGDLTYGDYGRWLGSRHADPEALRGPDNAFPSDYVAPEAWRTRIPPEDYPSTYIADRTVDFLRDAAGSDDDRPFFLQCSFPDPHHPFTPPGHYADLYDPDDVVLPASWDQPLEDCPPHVRFVRELFDRGERDIDIGFAYAVSEREAREAIALTYGMIAMIDDMVGRILDSLRETGLDRNTVIVFASDHGDYMGDHRLLLKGPVHYRGVTNVPFLWCDPDTPEPGHVFDGLASSIDFAPTVLARAGLQPFNGMQGRNLLPQIMGADTPAHDAIMIEEENQRLLFGFDAPPRIQSVLTEDLRLSIYDGIPWGELYDLRNDPDEMTNLWDDPAHQHMKIAALERMTRLALTLKDRSPHPTMRA